MLHTLERRSALPALLLAASAALAACRGAGGPAPTPPVRSTSPGADSALLRRDVATLASDAMEGRGTGTPGNDRAAAYIAERFVELGLDPVVLSAEPCPAAPKLGAGPIAGARIGAADPSRRARPCLTPYFQSFTARSAQLAHAGNAAGVRTQNVAALLPGSDPALRHQYVVIGAHFDHLGRSAESATDPAAKDAIRNGADDNASGTAAVLELARLLARRPVRRSVIFVAFSGEELGLLGSQYFVEHPPVPLDSMQAMLNFDMIGRVRNDKLLVYGVATSPDLPGIVQRANDAAGAGRFALTAIGDGFGPSDHSSFYGKNVPVLHFFSDLHADYHAATDDAEKVDAGGAARVVALAERIARELADRPTRLPFVRAPQPVAAMGPREGSDVYFGSVPDMAAVDAGGMRLTGVRPGSPAEQAGLRDGDVVVEFGGRPVKDLYEYSDALYSRKPGDVVQVVVLRGGERLTLTATLGRRGG